MKISLIAAIANNNVIGINNTIPWYLPADIDWFKKHTFNKPVLMGRCTWQSLKKPLRGRHNIVVSKTITNLLLADNSRVSLVSSIQLALDLALNLNYKEIMVIGGENIYHQMLKYADSLYLTYINLEVKGDSYFPIYFRNEWISIFQEFHSADQKNNYSYWFEILNRRYKKPVN
ncbi:MAG: type 3 dihydrofolate reductase [Candidatus Dasytiphilus stammeri]